LWDAVPRKAVVTWKHHDVGCGRGPGTALVGAAEAEIGRVVENTDAGIVGRQRLHAFQGTISASIIDKDDFVVAPTAHCFAHRADRCSDVVLFVEAGNHKTECRHTGVTERVENVSDRFHARPSVWMSSSAPS